MRLSCSFRRSASQSRFRHRWARWRDPRLLIHDQEASRARDVAPSKGCLMWGAVVKREGSTLIMAKPVSTAGIALGEYSYASIAIRQVIGKLIAKDYQVEWCRPPLWLYWGSPICIFSYSLLLHYFMFMFYVLVFKDVFSEWVIESCSFLLRCYLIVRISCA